ncbi:asparagine synthase (glutamine-hydrolyzing) [Candidatus Woesearchaeota archaeon]|nr:MAG: asparagine synthase (glutamine-hydrolyzing) [Candidatus Woesearchaeota archaeon]
MCGILGILSLNDKISVTKKEFKQILNEFIYRGPDAQSIYEEDNLLFGHNRLEIQGNSNQPLFNEDKSLVLICNGEIYNYDELRKELEGKGHKFNSNSDNEVLVHLYEEEKLNFFNKVNGFFSFAIYDFNEKKLVLAKDNMGKKPLFYYFDKEKIIFSSFLRSINKILDKKGIINELVLRRYFEFGNIPSPFTIFKNIYKVRPGQHIIFDLDKKMKVSTKNHFKLSFENKKISLTEAKEELDQIFEKSINSRINTDKNLGLLASGGLDSTGILYYIQKKIEKVNTYSVSFENEDQKYLDILNKNFNINSKILDFNEEAFHKNLDSIKFMAEPVTDDEYIPLFLLSKKYMKDIRILLTGDGADEIFAGYKYYANFLGRKFFDFKEFKNKGVLMNKLNEYGPDSIFKYYNINTTPLRQAMFYDMKLYLSDFTLPVVDNATMANSIETRSPFLDRRLIEYSSKLDENFLISHN